MEHAAEKDDFSFVCMLLLHGSTACTNSEQNVPLLVLSALHTGAVC